MGGAGWHWLEARSGPRPHFVRALRDSVSGWEAGSMELFSQTCSFEHRLSTYGVPGSL